MRCAALRGAPLAHPHERAVSLRELGGDAAVDDLEHLVAVVGVDGEGHLVQHRQRVLERLRGSAVQSGRTG